MCGRYVIGLDPDEICNLCAFKKPKKKAFEDINNNKTCEPKEKASHLNVEERKRTEADSEEAGSNEKVIEIEDEYIIPKWVEIVDHIKAYQPSYNLGPTMVSPVMILSNHLIGVKTEPKLTEEFIDSKERVLVPMKWGLIPSWWKNDPTQLQNKTINCKSETMTSKPSYRSAISKGRRCVVVVQGFFEWKGIGSSKQPYFIYSNKNKEDDETPYMKLLYLAGVFDIWHDKSTCGHVYSFSILTVDSVETKIAWIHGRMPVILEDEQSVDKWLDAKKYPINSNEIKQLIKGSNQINYHAVPKLVNFIRNDTVENIEKIEQPNTEVKSEESENGAVTSLPKAPMKLKKTISKYFIKQPKTESKSSSRSRSRSRSQSPKKFCDVKQEVKQEEP